MRDVSPCLPFLLCTLLIGCAIDKTDDISHPGSAIVGGQPETDWPQVVALVHASTSRLFCSGIAIADHWVLTAAHCLTDHTTTTFHIVVGDSIDHSDSTVHVPTSVVRHPDFVNGAYVHDMALISTLDAMDMDVYPALNAAPMPDDMIGRSIRHSGFGRTQTGTNGTRLFADLTVSSTGTTLFTSTWIQEDGTAFCFGDSGGAAFDDFGNGPSLIGVISNLFTDPQQSHPCIGTYGTTMIVPYLDWILSVIDSNDVDCNLFHGCLCSDACAQDGTCNNDACITGNCASGFDCLSRCSMGDSACIIDCYIPLSTESKNDLITLINCGATHCPQTPTTQMTECLFSYCEDAVIACFPSGYIDTFDTDHGNSSPKDSDVSPSSDSDPTSLHGARAVAALSCSTVIHPRYASVRALLFLRE